MKKESFWKTRQNKQDLPKIRNRETERAAGMLVGGSLAKLPLGYCGALHAKHGRTDITILANDRVRQSLTQWPSCVFRLCGDDDVLSLLSLSLFSWRNIRCIHHLSGFRMKKAPARLSAACHRRPIISGSLMRCSSLLLLYTKKDNHSRRAQIG